MAQDERSLDSQSASDFAEVRQPSEISMTTRYTDSEWAAIIEATESNVLSTITQIAKAVPPVDSPEFAQTIDHTLVKIESTRSHVDTLCSEARIAGFATVCVRPTFVSQACANTRGSSVRVCSIVGFPSGLDDLSLKIAELKHCVSSGAHELDLVLNRSHFAARPLPRYNAIYNELAAIRALAPHPTILKLILEVSQLRQREIIAACVLAGAANFDFVKTSTGLHGRGARVEDVRLMTACCEVLGEAAVGGWAGAGVVGENNEHVDERGMGVEDDPLDLRRHKRKSVRSSKGSDKYEYEYHGWARLRKRRMQVQASGGIKTLGDAVSMLQAGATRLGTSGGTWIMKEARERVERGIRKQSSRAHDLAQRNRSKSLGQSHHNMPIHVKPIYGHTRGQSLQVQPQPPRQSTDRDSRPRTSHSRQQNSVSTTKSGNSRESARSNTNKPLSPLPPSTTDAVVAISISARTNTLSTLKASKTQSSASHLAQATTTIGAVSGIKTATTTTVTVAGVSDVDHYGILKGNGVFLGGNGGEDRPGLVTRLYTDY